MPSLRRRLARAFPIVGFTIAAMLVATGCGSDKPLDTLAGDGSPAETINDLLIPVAVVAGVVFVFVQGAVVYMAWKYRAPRSEPEEIVGPAGYGDEEFPPQTHGHTRLEILWTIVPAAILAVISVFTVATIFDLDDVDAAEDDLKITVVGQQWWWEFQYHLDGDVETAPDFVTANEMLIPVGQEIPLQITSRDVIHSYWIPRLNGKKDAAPGRVHEWMIQANETGRFAGQCTEFCGLSHAYMKMWTEAVSPADFDVWVNRQIAAAEPLAEDDPDFAGQQLFLAQCSRCHMVVGVTDTNADDEIDDWAIYDGANKFLVDGNLVAGAAPNLTHFMSRQTFAGSFFDLYTESGELNRAQLEAWIKNAPEEKPNYPDGLRGMPAFTGLSEADVDALVDYLSTLD